MDTSLPVYHIVEGGGKLPFYLNAAKAIVRTVVEAVCAAALPLPPQPGPHQASTPGTPATPWSG
ncbi:MAG: hypothetical protein KJ624_05330 [Chloroflexi bacterium]|nr:hypothetical protein [Chloroflexota bacterium]